MDVLQRCAARVLDDKDSPMDMAYGMTQEDVLFSPGIRVRYILLNIVSNTLLTNPFFGSSVHLRVHPQRDEHHHQCGPQTDDRAAVRCGRHRCGRQHAAADRRRSRQRRPFGVAASRATGGQPMRRDRGAHGLRDGAAGRVRRRLGVLHDVPGHADVSRVSGRSVAERRSVQSSSCVLSALHNI